MLDKFLTYANNAASTVGDFFTGGGGEQVVSAIGDGGGRAAINGGMGGPSGVMELINAGQSGGALGVASDMFKTASGYAGTAFNWIEDNPYSANLIGGVAMGIGAQRSAQKDRDLQRELQRERFEAQKIVPGDMGSDYGSYRNAVSDGLISNGMIAADNEREAR